MFLFSPFTIRLILMSADDVVLPLVLPRSSHLLLGDPRLLLPVPLVIKQTVSIPVEYVQVVNGHLKHTSTEEH